MARIQQEGAAGRGGGRRLTGRDNGRLALLEFAALCPPPSRPPTLLRLPLNLIS